MNRFIKSNMRNTTHGDLIWESRVRESDGEVLAKSKVTRKDGDSIMQAFRMLNSFGFCDESKYNSEEDKKMLEKETREEAEKLEEERIKNIVKKSLDEERRKVQEFMKTF